MILHRLALTATILTLDQKPCLKVIAYFYFYSTIQVKFLGRLDHGKRDVFRTNEIGQRGMNNLINTNTSPTEQGPMVLLVLFTDSNQFYSQQNMKIQYKLQSQLYAGCSINALMHNFTDCTRSFMLEQTVLCLYVIYFY